MLQKQATIVLNIFYSQKINDKCANGRLIYKTKTHTHMNMLYFLSSNFKDHAKCDKPYFSVLTTSCLQLNVRKGNNWAELIERTK